MQVHITWQGKEHGGGSVSSGKDVVMELLIMENFFYGRSIQRVYDLKGSERDRYVVENPKAIGAWAAEEPVCSRCSNSRNRSHMARFCRRRSVGRKFERDESVVADSRGALCLWAPAKGCLVRHRCVDEMLHSLPQAGAAAYTVAFISAGFLSNVGVMDYSLLVGVDKTKHELVIGIIDFIRQVQDG